MKALRERTALEILDLADQPESPWVLLSSGDGGSIAPFALAVDEVELMDGESVGAVRARCGGKTIATLHSDIPYVVFRRDVVKTLSHEDVIREHHRDQQDADALNRELYPEAAAFADVQKRARAKVVEESERTEAGATGPFPGQYA